MVFERAISKAGGRAIVGMAFERAIAQIKA
jgi:hypothetical protein